MHKYFTLELIDLERLRMLHDSHLNTEAVQKGILIKQPACVNQRQLDSLLPSNTEHTLQWSSAASFLYERRHAIQGI